MRTPRSTSSQGGPIDTSAWLFERLLASPDHTLALLPGGQAKAEKLTTITVGEGAKKKEVTAWAITGIANYPIPIWADANNKFFGFSFFLSWLPEDYASEHVRLTEAQIEGARRAGARAREVAREDAGGRPWRSRTYAVRRRTRKQFLADRTVVIDKGLIVSEGAARNRRRCPRARRSSTAGARRCFRASGIATCTSPTTSPACRNCRWVSRRSAIPATTTRRRWTAARAPPRASC